MYNYPADLLPNNLYNPLFKLPLFLFNRPAEGSKSVPQGPWRKIIV